jgi:hypothetical protein
MNTKPIPYNLVERLCKWYLALKQDQRTWYAHEKNSDNSFVPTWVYWRKPRRITWYENIVFGIWLVVALLVLCVISTFTQPLFR